MVQHNFRKPEVVIARASDNHRQIVFFGFTFVLLVFDQGERRVLRVDPISDPPGHVRSAAAGAQPILHRGPSFRPHYPVPNDSQEDVP